MKIQTNYTNRQPKLKNNFKSTIMPTSFLKEGFEYAKKINNTPKPNQSDLYNVKRFTRGLIDMLFDERKHVIEITQSKRKSDFSLFHDVLINEKKVIIEGTCPGIAPDNIGRNAMTAVIDLTHTIPGITSHYERLVASIEKRPLPFKTDIKPQPLKYNQEQNKGLLDTLEKLIFRQK